MLSAESTGVDYPVLSPANELLCPEDTKNWQAGVELGQELKDEGENNEPVSEILLRNPQLRFLLKIVNEAMRETPRMRRMKRKNKFSLLDCRPLRVFTTKLRFFGISSTANQFG